MKPGVLEAAVSRLLTIAELPAHLFTAIPAHSVRRSYRS